MIIRLSLNRVFSRKDDILLIYITSLISYKLTSFLTSSYLRLNVVLALLFLQEVLEIS